MWLGRVRVTSLDSGYLLSKNVILFDHATHAIQCCGTHTSQAAKLSNLSGGTLTHVPSSTILLLLFNSNKYFIILACLVCCCLEGLLERTDKTGAGLAPPCFYSRCGKVQAAVIQTNPINWRQCTAMQGSTKHLGRIKLPFLRQKELIFWRREQCFGLDGGLQVISGQLGLQVQCPTHIKDKT